MHASLRWFLAVSLALATALLAGSASAQCSVTSEWYVTYTVVGCPVLGWTNMWLCDNQYSYWGYCTGPTAPVEGEYGECPYCTPPPGSPPGLESCPCVERGGGNDAPPCVYEGDPVHVGSGAFLTEPIVDVRFEGSRVPLEIVRYYGSRSHWLPPDSAKHVPDRALSRGSRLDHHARRAPLRRNLVPGGCGAPTSTSPRQSR